MELHERFLKLPTTGINILETLAGDRNKELQLIRELVDVYNKKIFDNVLDLKTLKTFRMILCYKYQSLVHLYNRDEAIECQSHYQMDVRTLFIKNSQYRKTEEFYVLYDIVVLQLVFADKTLLRMAFKDFWQAEGILSSTESLNLAMKVSECFADSYNLYAYVHKSPDNPAELEEELTCILRIIQFWIKQKEGLEWKLLASLLPKLIVTFESQKIVSPLWQHTLGSLEILPPFTDKKFSEITDLDDKLTALCVIADVCFPSDLQQVEEFHYEQCLQNEFWCVLNRGLVSKNLQQRKQALYLLKRALEFVDYNKSEVKKRLNPLQTIAMPFVCIKSEDQESSLEAAKKNFFLILEVLEEEQKHLVIPTLWRLTNLVEVQADHKLCCDCFNLIWLRCIYQRIVQHNKNSIKIFGLKEILSDPHIFFDDAFLLFFVDALNNTFLYEYNDEDGKPEIVKELERSFLKWEQEKIPLINSFVKTLPSVSWSPVAIYWVIQALLAVTDQCRIVTNVWGDVELRCIEDLIQKSLMKHNRELRTYSQVVIIRTFRAYTLRSVSAANLECIFNILCSFPDNKMLHPGCTEWRKIAEHLSMIIQTSDAVEYVTQTCEKTFADTQNMKSLARTIFLLAESELIFSTQSCPAEKALRNLLQNLIGADVRPYADKDLILKLIEFSGYLTNSNIWDDSTVSRTKIDILIRPYTHAMLKIVAKSLESKTISKYDDYVFVVNALLNRTTCEVFPSEGMEELNHIQHKCIIVISNPHDYCRNQWSYAVTMLLTCRRHGAELGEWRFGFTFITLMLGYFRTEVIDNRGKENVEQQNGNSNGTFASDCPEKIAELLLHFFRSSSAHLWPLDVDWIENLQGLVETGNEQVIDHIVGILWKGLRENSLRDHDFDIINIVCMAWRILFHGKKSPATYRNGLEIISLITSYDFLGVKGSVDFAYECIDYMMRAGEKEPLLKKRLLHFTVNDNMICFHKSYTFALLHGAVPRRDQRIEDRALAHSHKIVSERSFIRTDMDIRITAIEKLITFCDKPELQDVNLDNLLEILEENKNKRYYDNSHLHRQKLRVMQTLLVLEPILNESQRKELYDVLCDLLIAESNQPSVRLMHEWLLIRICLKSPEMQESFWELFDTAADRRPGSIVSLASVVFHVARKLSEETQRDYIVKAILRLLPNCMCQHFNVRLYSQTILYLMYQMLPEDSTEANTYKEIMKSVKVSLGYGNLQKNSTKVFDDFYFTVFDPVLDFNMATIYYHLPRLTNVASDELMEINHEIAYLANDEIYMEFAEYRRLLQAAKPTAQSSKPTGEFEGSADSTTDGRLSDVQKKIIPWKTMVPFYDDLSEISKAKLLRRKTQNEERGIIVVASLIDRPPNLGGIARTCEIFGAKELVIGSLRYAENREFQTLSVSAEKWITITEVKPHLLQSYLLEKQSEGWKLVGAEQTANSTNLLEMEFPKKTVLLLGNEKDGIPANLIPLMDTCVEIPQDGVVRSLNVHVTGAICIWQYAKQHVLT